MQDFSSQIPFEYWNKLANQIITISSLLGGFSIAVIANILVSSSDSRIVKWIMVIATLAASFFMVTIFGMTKLVLMTTEGYPFPVVSADLTMPRLVGTVSFLFGVFSLVALISMAGWTKSKKMGMVTTSLGILTLALILLMIT